MNCKTLIFFLGSISLLLGACTKYEGKGGSSTISGVLSAKVYNDAGVLVSEYPKSEEDVYIIYGEGKTAYSDKVSCSYDGSFQFDYLEKGKYTVFYYEDCASCPDGKQVQLIPVEIEKNKSEVDLGTISVNKNKNTGTSAIKGSIHVMNYDSSGSFINEGIGPDVDVYLIYGENTSYTDKLKSSHDGSFIFPELGKGKYTVYAYSKCPNCPSGVQAVLIETEIKTDNKTINVGELVIND